MNEGFLLTFFNYAGLIIFGIMFILIIIELIKRIIKWRKKYGRDTKSS